MKELIVALMAVGIVVFLPSVSSASEFQLRAALSFTASMDISTQK